MFFILSTHTHTQSPKFRLKSCTTPARFERFLTRKLNISKLNIFYEPKKCHPMRPAAKNSKRRTRCLQNRKWRKNTKLWTRKKESQSKNELEKRIKFSITAYLADGWKARSKFWIQWKSFKVQRSTKRAGEPMNKTKLMNFLII